MLRQQEAPPGVKPGRGTWARSRKSACGKHGLMLLAGCCWTPERPQPWQPDTDALSPWGQDWVREKGVFRGEVLKDD